MRSLWRGFVATLTLLAVVYLWFLARVGTELRAAAARVDDDVRRVADHAGSRARAGGVRDRSRQSTRTPRDTPRAFPRSTIRRRRSIDALHQVERELGRPRPTVVATPKWSLLSPFYRASGVSGQLGPFFLETLLNPDLTGPERPAVLAHEWAHLSGYAPESDASFVGLLAALRAGPAAEYSAWLDLVSEVGEPAAAGDAAPRARRSSRRDRVTIRRRSASD